MQITDPQSRQWCFRISLLNVFPHPGQTGTPWSGTQEAKCFSKTVTNISRFPHNGRLQDSISLCIFIKYTIGEPARCRGSDGASCTSLSRRIINLFVSTRNRSIRLSRTLRKCSVCLRNAPRSCGSHATNSALFSSSDVPVLFRFGGGLSDLPTFFSNKPGRQQQGLANPTVINGLSLHRTWSPLNRGFA